jgi:signal transduction histidine kinase
MGAGEGRDKGGRTRSKERAERRAAQSIMRDAAIRLDGLRGVERHFAAARGDPATTGDPSAEAAQIVDATRRDLREADAALDDLAREARIALTVIKGRAQLLRRQAFAAGAADLRLVRAVDEIDRAVTALDRLLRDGMLAPVAPADRYPADS